MRGGGETTSFKNLVSADRLIAPNDAPVRIQVLLPCTKTWARQRLEEEYFNEKLPGPPGCGLIQSMKEKSDVYNRINK